MTLVLSSSAVLGTTHHSVPGLIPQVPHISPGGHSARWHPGPAALVVPMVWGLLCLSLVPCHQEAGSTWPLVSCQLLRW